MFTFAKYIGIGGIFMARGILGNIFDIDCNGKLDALERASEFAFLEEWAHRNDPLAYESEGEFIEDFDWD